jgi:hypothetical protein
MDIVKAEHQQHALETATNKIVAFAPRLTRAERFAMGESLRKKCPRSSHAEWKPQKGRPDPVKLIEEADEGRIPQLVPLRHVRMLASLARHACWLPGRGSRHTEPGLPGRLVGNRCPKGRCQRQSADRHIWAWPRAIPAPGRSAPGGRSFPCSCSRRRRRRSPKGLAPAPPPRERKGRRRFPRAACS